METYIKEVVVTSYIGPQGLPAYKSEKEECKNCGHNEFEVHRGAGVTSIYCCKCENIHGGG